MQKLWTSAKEIASSVIDRFRGPLVDLPGELDNREVATSPKARSRTSTADSSPRGETSQRSIHEKEVEHANASQPKLEDVEKSAIGQVVDPQNTVFNSFIGVSRLPMGKILIGKHLGSGKFGHVYRGKWGDRTVALKKIDFSAQISGLDKNEALEALSWEIARLSTVSHPNIVQFYGIYQHENEGATYLIMEFCEGGDLRKELNRKKDISWAKRWQWAIQICEAVAYLHMEGVLHRDLKAENILLDGNARAKLADLGVAQVDALLQTEEAHVVTTGQQDNRFTAPEYIDHPTGTKATDIYALGLVLWEIASGEELKWEDVGEPLEEDRIPESCPQSFKELILDCCNEDPAKRPNAEELVKRIKQLGPELNPPFHILIEACEQVEIFLHSKRKEGLAYIEPFVTARAVEEPIENYWDKWEGLQKNTAGSNSPLNLKDIFLNFLKKSGSSTLLLLGEAGLGKTLTIYLWADELMREWWSYIKDPTTQRPPYFPVFIRDTVSDWTHAALKGAYLKILQQYGLKSDVQPLVFVDGYDELQMNEVPINLVKHLGLENTNAKVIVTCRPKTVDDNALDERFSFKGKLETVHFLPFSIDQLMGYLKKQLSWEKETEEVYKKTLQASKSVREVLRNPFVLYLLRQSWETLSQQPLSELNRWKIYEGFVKHSITTQSSLLPPQLQASLAAGYLNLVESFEVFASDLALRACQKGGITFSLQEAADELTYPWIKLKELVAEDARKQFAKRQEELNKAVNVKAKAKKYSRALLREPDFISVMQKRRQQFEDDLPLEIRRDEYTFSHKSLFEYFVAKRLLEIFESKDEFISKADLASLTKKLIGSDPEVLLFLHEGWKERESTALTIDVLLKDHNRKVNSNTLLEKISLLLNAIGRVLNERAAKYEEALEYYLKCLAIEEQVYCEDHPDVAASYNNIGLVLQAKGKHDEALVYFKKGLAIFEEGYWEDHPNVATFYNNIGNVLEEKGKHEEALEYYKKALAIWEKEHGKEHPDVATSYNNIGLALQSKGKHEEALEYYKKALAIWEKEHGKEHPDVATSYNNIGMVLYKQGKYAEALKYHMKALAIWEQVYGKDHPQVATSYDHIWSVLKAQVKDGETLKYHMKALAIWEQVHGKAHPDVATSYDHIGALLLAQGKHSEALEYFKESLAIREQVYGKGHPSTLECMQIIQYLEQQIGTQAVINEFINTPDASTVQALLQMSGLDSNEVKVTVNANKIGEINLLLSFSSSTDFKKFVKYCKSNYKNLFLPNSQLEYNPGQAVEIFLNAKVFHESVMPDLNHFKNHILQGNE